MAPPVQFGVRFGEDTEAVEARLDALLDKLSSAITAHGGRPSRAAVLRLAAYRGLEVLEREHGLSAEAAT